MHSRYLKLLGLTMLAAISVMAVSASAAQAKYLLLLNGASVNLLNLELENLPGYIKAENGLKVSCSGGTGNAMVEVSGTKLVGTASGTFTGCKWVGSEKTCTIKDPVAGKEAIVAGGAGEVTMPDASTYVVKASSEEFSTIHTEGIFCTIPEEEVVSGTGSATIENALADTTVKLATLKADALFLGESKVTELVGEVHVRDENLNATFGVHLVGL